MITRIISGGIALAAFIGIVIAPPAALKIVMALLSGIGAYELYKATGYIRYKLLFFLAVAGGLMFPFLDIIPYKEILYIYLLIFAAAGIFTLLFNHESFSSSDLAAAMLYPVMYFIAFSVPSYLRSGEWGGYLIWMPFIAAWSTDTFAYFTGVFFGKNKLCEKLSPKKTIEGAAGGICGAVLGITIYSLFAPFKINIFAMAIYAIFASVLSQAGDIFASCIKREHNIKDFGNIMPGHGGVLDRFDSLLLTAPLTYIFLELIKLGA